MSFHIDHITCPICYKNKHKTVIMREVGFDTKFKKCFKCGYTEIAIPAEEIANPTHQILTKSQTTVQRG